MTRRSHNDLTADAADALAVALAPLDVVATAADGGVDVVLDGREYRLAVEAKAYCTGPAARELVRRRRRRHGGPLVLVADKITAEARDILSDAGWSWLDRQGRMHLRAPGLRVEADVPGTALGAPRQARGPAVAGPGGIRAAYWLCAHPGRALSPTKHAPELGVAPSTISAAVKRLAEAGLVDDERRGVFPELFWELAAVWHSERVWLAGRPVPPLRPAGGPTSPGWRLTGAAAAAAYEAPVYVAPDGPVEWYVANPAELAAAARRWGTAEPGTGSAVLTVAPAPVVLAPTEGWVPLVDGHPAAPVMAVALDLAQDRVRGREILDGWDHPDAVWR